MFITSVWLIDILILLILLCGLLYKYSIRKYDFFEKRNIPYIKPIPFFGSMFSVITLKITIGEWLQNLYNSFDAPIFGVFMYDEPYIILKSPEIIKQVLIKDFNKFSDRTILAPDHNEILSNVMFMQKSPYWKAVRAKMTPVFTTGKLKGMVSLVEEVGKDMVRYLHRRNDITEAKDLSARFFTDVISKCAFAIHSNAFEKEDSEMRAVGRRFFEFTLRNSLVQNMYFFKPGWANFLRLNFFDNWSISFLRKVFWSAIEEREKSNVKGNDLIDIIVSIRKNNSLSDELNFDGDKALAQAVMFFAAGFETTSSTLSFTLYELSLQPDLQERARKEIITVLNDNDGINYDSLNKLKYLEMCIYETLRKYPALSFLDRRCNEPCKLNGTDYVIEKGMPVYISMMGLHYDEKFFPEPHKYDPERFADRSEHNINGLYYLPFGEGPRNCIGERFGMIGVKIGLISVLSKFSVEKVPKTPVPVKFEPRSIVLQSTVGLPLKFKVLKAVGG